MGLLRLRRGGGFWGWGSWGGWFILMRWGRGICLRGWGECKGEGRKVMCDDFVGRVFGRFVLEIVKFRLVKLKLFMLLFV